MHILDKIQELPVEVVNRIYTFLRHPLADMIYNLDKYYDINEFLKDDTIQVNSHPCIIKVNSNPCINSFNSLINYKSKQTYFTTLREIVWPRLQVVQVRVVGPWGPGGAWCDPGTAGDPTGTAGKEGVWSPPSAAP